MEAGDVIFVDTGVDFECETVEFDYSGDIGEPKIYTHTLSDDEIDALANVKELTNKNAGEKTSIEIAREYVKYKRYGERVVSKWNKPITVPSADMDKLYPQHHNQPANISISNEQPEYEDDAIVVEITDKSLFGEAPTEIDPNIKDISDLL